MKGSSTRCREESKTNNRATFLHVDCSEGCGTLCAMPTTVAVETVLNTDLPSAWDLCRVGKPAGFLTK